MFYKIILIISFTENKSIIFFKPLYDNLQLLKIKKHIDG